MYIWHDNIILLKNILFFFWHVLTRSMIRLKYKSRIIVPYFFTDIKPKKQQTYLNKGMITSNENV